MKFQIKNFMSLLMLTCASLLSIDSRAQSIHIGVKGGANLDRFNTGYNRGLGRLNYHLGGFLELPINNAIGIQPEILFNPTSTRVALEGIRNRTTARFNLRYLSIPVLLNLSPSESFCLQVGPQFSVLTNRRDNAIENLDNAFSRGDLAMVFGARFGSGPVKLYARYNIGVTDIGSLPYQDEWKSRQIQVGLSLDIF